LDACTVQINWRHRSLSQLLGNLPQEKQLPFKATMSHQLAAKETVRLRIVFIIYFDILFIILFQYIIIYYLFYLHIVQGGTHCTRQLAVELPAVSAWCCTDSQGLQALFPVKHQVGHQKLLRMHLHCNETIARAQPSSAPHTAASSNRKPAAPSKTFLAFATVQMVQ
jgi:hypothetical protein